MKPGPKPKPTHTLLLRGNGDVKRKRQSEPKLEPHVPARPEHLSETGAVVWDYYAQVLGNCRVLTEADSLALEQLAETYAEWWDAEQLVRREGILWTNPRTGAQHVHAAVRVRDAARKHLCRLLCELGLTPSSRTGISALDPEADEPETIT
ncbi:MAG: phage terminase small subunit P27 family [Candidatus Pacebacteria bacterium]|nr:phage terminase small subunit P27 family [Candidatus Paceibacterota bacterium]